MYPGYRPRDVLDEYAITFFSLLNEGYRQRHERDYMLAIIARIPFMDQEQYLKMLKQLEWASKESGDILKPNGEGNSPAEIKRFFGRI